VLKALGMSKSQNRWVIEQEAIVVSVLGVITGVVFTFACACDHARYYFEIE